MTGDRKDPTGEPIAVWRPLAGGLLAVAVLPLLIVLPEAGLPLAYVALRLLATRFPWASRADARLRRTAARARSRFRALPWPWRTAIVTAVAAALTAALWWTLSTAS
jgi:hypothetical protein